MNRLGKNELMLGRHSSLDEMLERIDQVTLEDIGEMLNRMMKQPCAIAMVGSEEKWLTKMGREFVVSGAAETASGE
jgi:predicted Zn-dependent peptidase